MLKLLLGGFTLTLLAGLFLYISLRIHTRECTHDWGEWHEVYDKVLQETKHGVLKVGITTVERRQCRDCGAVQRRDE